MKKLATALVATLALSLSAPARAEGDPEALVKAASGIAGRDPTGEATAFKSGERVFAWSQIKNAGGQSVEHVWKRDGKEIWRARFDVGGNKWRVNSHRSSIEPGSYLVEVTSGDKVLGSVQFTVR
jgi:hypothetical protein